MPLSTSWATSSVMPSDEVFVPSLPVTEIGYAPAAACAGTSISSWALAGAAAVAVTAVTTKPPPRSVAFHPSGTPSSPMLTASVEVVATSMSSLTVDPASVSIAGYGVDTVRGPSAWANAGPMSALPRTAVPAAASNVTVRRLVMRGVLPADSPTWGGPRAGGCADGDEGWIRDRCAPGERRAGSQAGI